jgi:phosphoglycerate dehydrogenase-like enzyme
MILFRAGENEYFSRMANCFTIWCNVDFTPPLLEQFRKGVQPHRLVQAADKSANNLAGASADPLLESADIAFGQPDPQQVMRLPRLRWVQLTTAGYTRYDTPAFREAVKTNGTIMCNASSIYAEPCAQHVMAMMLALARRIPHSRDNQNTEHAWLYLPLRSNSKLLNGQIVLLVGYGAIARRVVELLAPFQMKVIGFRRHANEPNVLPIDQLDQWLPRADHVINLLPSSAQTDRFFDAHRFAKLKPEANYYNIGRGSTNDESALQTALESGRLAAAYIDAFETEPLPKEHPLWTTRNCFITPHTAGGHSNEYERHVEQFLENLRRLGANEPLIDRIM